jgi:serine acetyltransferase
MNGIELYTQMRNARNKLFSWSMRASFMSFGPKSTIQMPVVVHGSRRIAIGADVFLGADSWLNVLGEQALLEIGDGTRISGHCVISAVDHVRLGRHVLLGRNVFITDHNHGTTEPNTPIGDQDLQSIALVYIEDNVWLGQHSVILPGVRVGRGAVVGANSVVLDDVPPRSVVVGAPARVVRHLDGAPNSRETAPEQAERPQPD